MTILFEEHDHPIETALVGLLKHLRYHDKVSMDYEQLKKECDNGKYQFQSLSFRTLYKNDPEFNLITSKLFAAFCVKRPDNALYAALERAGANFYKTYRGSQKIKAEPDFGSSSEFSDDLSLDDSTNKQQKKLTQKIHFYHSKLRVCSGMKAIVLAHYGALSYFKANGIKSYQYDVEQMYFEVEEALAMVIKPDGLREVDKLKANFKDIIMYFDLNHCNATNSDANLSLSDKLAAIKPAVAILDYTSSTHEEVKLAAKQCLRHNNVQLVLMVDSGLKNNQGGQDLNPYGEVRIMTRDRGVRKEMVDVMRNALSEEDKLPQIVHEMVRASKRRGLAFSMQGLFQSDSQRYQPVVIDNTAPKLGN